MYPQPFQNLYLYPPRCGFCIFKSALFPDTDADIRKLSALLIINQACSYQNGVATYKELLSSTSKFDEDIMPPPLRGRFDRVYLGGDAPVFFGFRYLFQALLVVDVLALFVFFCGRLVPHRLFPSSVLL